MRPKTFTKRLPIGFESEYARKSDGELEPALASLVRSYRARLWSNDDSPKRDEIRATLRRISAMQPIEALLRWKTLHTGIRAEIYSAASICAIQCSNVTDNLPSLASVALNNMQTLKAGRPRVTEMAVELAERLAIYWVATKNIVPTVQSVSAYRKTKYQAWACDIFKRAGFGCGDIIKTLQAGLRNAKKSGNLHKHIRPS